MGDGLECQQVISNTAYHCDNSNTDQKDRHLPFLLKGMFRLKKLQAKKSNGGGGVMHIAHAGNDSDRS